MLEELRLHSVYEINDIKKPNQKTLNQLMHMKLINIHSFFSDKSLAKNRHCFD